MPNLISTDKLTKEYTENLLKPVRVLNNLCLSIREGDFVSLMGPSGSGKSTLLNLLGLLDVPTNGEIFFDGLEITRLTRKKKAILRNISFGFHIVNCTLSNDRKVCKFLLLSRDD